MRSSKFLSDIVTGSMQKSYITGIDVRNYFGKEKACSLPFFGGAGAGMAPFGGTSRMGGGSEDAHSRAKQQKGAEGVSGPV